MFISQFPAGNHVVILARSQPREEKTKTQGVSLFIADLPNEAITFQPMKKMGCHFMETGALYIDNLRECYEHLLHLLGFPANLVSRSYQDF